jgi:surfactin synthase thioesterase subunit
MAQLEALQLAVGDATGALNARGDTLEDRLQDIPMHAREVALHGVRRGAVVALEIAQVRSRHDLHLVEPSL